MRWTHEEIDDAEVEKYQPKLELICIAVDELRKKLNEELNERYYDDVDAEIAQCALTTLLNDIEERVQSFRQELEEFYTSSCQYSEYNCDGE